MIDESKQTTFSSVCVIILRELRVERGIHQAQIAEALGNKSASSWTKIESGKNLLSFETFIRVCQRLLVAPSSVVACAERYAAILAQNGWAVVAELEESSKDLLIREAQQYWEGFAPAGFQNNWNSILNGPAYDANGALVMAPVFYHVCYKPRLNMNSSI